MLKLELTEDETQVLPYERYPHPHVRQTREVLGLKSQGLAPREMARRAGVSENTLRSDWPASVPGGWAGRREVRRPRPPSALDEPQALLTT
jgi:transposase